MTLRRSPHVLLLASSALVLSACGSTTGDSGRPTVVTSFYPVEFVAQRVAGGTVDITNLTAPGGEPHDVELSPRQAAEVQDADLVVYQSGFQPAVDEAVEQADRAEGTTVDATEGVALLDDPEAAAPADGTVMQGDAVDPHLWLDPTNLDLVTEQVRDALVEVDPDNAAQYRANAEELLADLGALDEELRTGLAQCEVRDIVTSHAAFGYLADAYDLVQVPIAGIDPGTEPSAAQLAEITDLVREKGITTVFTETLVSPAVARTVAREAGVETATLDPIEGLSDATSDEDYLSIMRSNLTTLQKANRCS